MKLFNDVMISKLDEGYITVIRLDESNFFFKLNGVVACYVELLSQNKKLEEIYNLILDRFPDIDLQTLKLKINEMNSELVRLELMTGEEGK